MTDYATPVGWRYKTLINKHATGLPLAGQISMLDIHRTPVWGNPGAWRYSDGPERPDLDWMCEAEPLYMATAAEQERERCAKVAEDTDIPIYYDMYAAKICVDIAARIRSGK